MTVSDKNLKVTGVREREREREKARAARRYICKKGGVTMKTSSKSPEPVAPVSGMVRLLQRLSALFLPCKLANKAWNGLHLVLSPGGISDEYRTFVSLSQNFKPCGVRFIPTEMLRLF